MKLSTSDRIVGGVVLSATLLGGYSLGFTEGVKDVSRNLPKCQEDEVWYPQTNGVFDFKGKNTKVSDLGCFHQEMFATNNDTSAIGCDTFNNKYVVECVNGYTGEVVATFDLYPDGDAVYVTNNEETSPDVGD